MSSRTLILPASDPRPDSWVTVENAKGVRMHTPTWAWDRIKDDTSAAVEVEDCTTEATP